MVLAENAAFLALFEQLALDLARADFAGDVRDQAAHEQAHLHDQALCSKGARERAHPPAGTHPRKKCNQDIEDRDQDLDLDFVCFETAAFV